MTAIMANAVSSMLGVTVDCCTADTLYSVGCNVTHRKPIGPSNVGYMIYRRLVARSKWLLIRNCNPMAFSFMDVINIFNVMTRSSPVAPSSCLLWSTPQASWTPTTYSSQRRTCGLSARWYAGYSASPRHSFKRNRRCPRWHPRRSVALR